MKSIFNSTASTLIRSVFKVQDELADSVAALCEELHGDGITADHFGYKSAKALGEESYYQSVELEYEFYYANLNPEVNVHAIMETDTKRLEDADKVHKERVQDGAADARRRIRNALSLIENGTEGAAQREPRTTRLPEHALADTPHKFTERLQKSSSTGYDKPNAIKLMQGLRQELNKATKA